MSARRAARAAAVVEAGGVPESLRSRLHPLWSDPDAAAAEYSDFLRPEDRGPTADLRLHAVVLSRWARANGYESGAHPGLLDWPRLRVAMGAR